jgi:hypothetical protein
MCDQCAITRKSDNDPWLQGCKAKGGGQHHFVWLGEDGPTEWNCNSCGATVFLRQSQSPAGSRCPESGTSHRWRTR